MAATYDLDIEQGATFSKRFVWKTADGVPIDLTVYSARMQIRKSRSAQTPMIELSSANGGISLGGPAGTVELTITAAQTAGFTSGGVYDLELINGLVVTRFIEGAVNLSPEVTR